MERVDPRNTQQVHGKGWAGARSAPMPCTIGGRSRKTGAELSFSPHPHAHHVCLETFLGTLGDRGKKKETSCATFS
jgi:hypothetical protein